MRSKIFICILFFVIGHFAISQQLTLNETITYINQSMSSDKRFLLSRDGMVTYSGISEFGKAFTYTVHISEIKAPLNIEQLMISFDDGHPWLVSLKCKGSRPDPLNKNWSYMIDCIQGISEGKKSNISSFSLYTKNSDNYTTQKLLNAVNYLFALAKEQGLDERNDDDPFAPNNYNPQSIEIKGIPKVVRSNCLNKTVCTTFQ